MGTMLYGFDWPAGGGPAHPGVAQALRRDPGADRAVRRQPVYDGVKDSWHLAYTDASGVGHDVWFSDAPVVNRRVALATERGPRLRLLADRPGGRAHVGRLRWLGGPDEARRPLMGAAAGTCCSPRWRSPRPEQQRKPGAAAEGVRVRLGPRRRGDGTAQARRPAHRRGRAANWYALDVRLGKPGDAAAAPTRCWSPLERRRAVWPDRQRAHRRHSPLGAPAVRGADRRFAAGRRASLPGVSGVTLDMEELRAGQRGPFSALVREAAAGARGRPQARRLRAAAGPVAGAAYDWDALARHADLLLASGYNEHWAGGRPGSDRPRPQIRRHRRAGARRRRPAQGRARPRRLRLPLAGGRRPGQLISTRDAGAASARAASVRADADTVVYNTARRPARAAPAPREPPAPLDRAVLARPRARGLLARPADRPQR